MRRFAAITALSMLGISAPGQDPQPLAPISDVVRDGPSAFSGPIRVRGIVTYIDSVRRSICVQDGDVGLFGRIPGDIRQLKPGQRVELSGKIVTNHFMEVSDVRVISDDRLPAAVPVDANQFAAGSKVNVRVTVTGIVRAVGVENDQLALLLMSGKHRVRVYVSSALVAAKTLDRYIDAEVQVTGVCGPASGDRTRPDLTRLLIQSIADVEVTRAAPDLAITPIAKVPDKSQHRVRVVGLATESVESGVLKLESEGKFIHAAVAPHIFARKGERFDVAGFPERRDGVLHLDDAQARQLVPRVSAIPGSNDPKDFVPVIQSAEELRRLSSREAALRAPVRIRGVVTFHGFADRTLFVHDGVAGIAVQAPSDLPRLESGTVVVVDGHSDRGEFAPSVSATNVVPLRDGRLPDTRRYGYDELLGGRQDGQWIEIEGVVRGVEPADRDETILMLRFGPTTVPVRIASVKAKSLQHLFGALIRLRGVCGSKVNARRQWDGLVLFAPSTDSIEVRRPAPPDLAVMTPQNILSLSQFDPDRGIGEVIKLTGRLIYRRGDSAMIQDSTGGIAIELQPRQPGEPGDRLEILGFLVRRGDFWAVEDGLTKVTADAAAAPGPMDVTPADVVAGGYVGTLIRVEGILLDQFPLGESDEVLVLQSAESGGRPIIFPAILPRDRLTTALSELKPGSRLRVTGACSLSTDRNNIASFRVFLRHASDVEVIEQPPWWTPRKALGVAGAIAAMAVFAWAWVITLRRRVRGQTDVIRKRLERETRLEAQYRDLFESASDAVFTLDSNGAVTTMNAAARKLTGLAEGDSFLQVVAATSTEDVRELISAAIPATREISLAAPAEATVVEVSARPIVDAGSTTRVQAIARDLTHRRRIEADLRQSQKMEIVGRLAGGIAHDFNNLLTVINGNGEVLRARLSETDAALAEDIVRAGEQAATLTRQLLAFSRKGVIAPQVLFPNETIENVRPAIVRLIGEQCELITDLDPRAGNVRIDPGQLEQILINLAINARDAMPQGGTLTIRTRCEADHVRIEVIDTGTGMDAKTSSRVFEPFFTTKPAGEGTGLGLATVKSIVEEAGGTISVHSEPGRGAAFAIDLPEVEKAPTSPVPIAAASKGREVILLVEDEPAVQLLERRVLEMGRYEVLVASSGEEALEIFERQQARIDLLITDVVMPGIAGRELAEIVSRRKPGTPVLFLSGYAPDEVLRQGVRSEEVHFLQKPFTPSSLLSKVRDILARPKVLCS